MSSSHRVHREISIILFTKIESIAESICNQILVGIRNDYNLVAIRKSKANELINIFTFYLKVADFPIINKSQ